MSNEEIILNDLQYLRDANITINVYQELGKNPPRYIVDACGIKTTYNAQELKEFLHNLKNGVDDLEEEQAKKRRQMRALLLEASEEIAHKFNKQVYTLSIGEREE